VNNLGVDAGLCSISYNNALVALGISGSISGVGESRILDPSYMICSKVIQQDAPLVITDARNDPRTCENRFVRSGQIFAYIGVPVRNAEIGAIGAVCVFTAGPREWSTADVRYVEAIAETVENLILREMYRLESADASNLLSEYDQIISAFSLVRAEATSIHDNLGRLVFANRALMEHVEDDELQSSAMKEVLLGDAGQDPVRLTVQAGTRFAVTRQKTGSGYSVCQWTPDETMLN
jgi:GAF domain-containing protein